MIVEDVPLSACEADPNQPRQSIDAQEILNLAGSMQRLGQQQPAIVYRTGNRFGVVDGHRRLEAARRLSAATFKAIVLDEPPSADRLLLTQLAANCLRVDLKPMEKARAFDRLKASRSWSNTELARQLCISKSKVTECLAYLTLPESLQAKLDAGELGGSTAYAIARAPDDATRQSLMDEASHGTLSRDSANQAVRRCKAHKSRVCCMLPEAQITIVSSAKLTMDGLVNVLRELVKRCRQAAELDVETFQRVLADQSKRSDADGE